MTPAQEIRRWALVEADLKLCEDSLEMVADKLTGLSCEAYDAIVAKIDEAKRAHRSALLAVRGRLNRLGAIEVT